MNVSVQRLIQIFGELKSLLGSSAVRALLRQLPDAEAAYFHAQQNSIRRLIVRAMAALSDAVAAGVGPQKLAGLASEIVKVQKSLAAVTLVSANKPDDVRIIVRQVSNLALKLENRIDAIKAEAIMEATFRRMQKRLLQLKPKSGLRRPEDRVMGFGRCEDLVPPQRRLKDQPSSRKRGRKRSPSRMLRKPKRLRLGRDMPRRPPKPPNIDWLIQPMAKLVPTIERMPRYANAALLDARSGRLLDRESPLELGHVLRLRLDIGRLSSGSQVSKVSAFPERKVLVDVDLDVMVSSTDFTVGSTANALGDSTVAHGRFLLPGDGSPATGPDGHKFLTFYLKAPARAGPARCRIGYYYRNILLQSQQVIAAVGRPGGFKIETDFTLSEDLTNLENIPTQPRLSVLTNSNGKGSHQIVLRSVDSQSGNVGGETFQVDNVGETIKHFRRILAERAPDTKSRRRAQLEEDLRQFAPHGWTLYTQVAAQHTHMFQPLYDKPDGFVVQVIRPKSSGFVFPWALVYQIPLHLKKPPLCRLISEWTDKEPLITGSPRECPYGPHYADILCPFGFWGFRYAIEQPPSADKRVQTIHASDTCDFVVAQAQYEVDLKALKDHVDHLRTVLHGALPNAQLREGKDKNTIEKLLGQDLPLVYFYCHGVQQNVTDPNTSLGIGNRETITTKDFIGWVVSWQLSQKKQIWDEVRPLIFLNACHSVAIYPDTLVSYLDAFVGTAHAAGVIGTEVRVNPTLAIDVANQFFSLLLGKQYTVESALRRIRFDYLASGNLFGLIYTPYCWADLRITRSVASG